MFAALLGAVRADIDRQIGWASSCPCIPYQSDDPDQ
jgi:hypothetical protein